MLLNLMDKKIPIYEVLISEYNFKKGKPDFNLISSKLIKCLRENFFGKRIALRLLGSMDHPGKSKDDIIKIVKKLGTDRYDSSRKGDRYENIDNKDIDFFALEFKVGNDNEEEYIKWALNSFYEWPIKDRSRPIRIDIGVVYDLSKLRVVEHKYLGRESEIKRDGFVFKNPKNKKSSILGIIKIL